MVDSSGKLPENSATHGIDGRNRFFFVYGSGQLGLKLIPKCGSTSLRLNIGLDEGRAQDLPKWRQSERRVVVCRHPADRLRSVYTAFSDKHGLRTVKKWQQAYGFKPGCTVDEFLQFVLDQPDPLRDWHWQSADFQLEYVRDDITDYVAIEQYDTYQFMPSMDGKERLNQSDPERTVNTPFWTPEQVRLIERDRPKDFEMWERALQNTRT